MPRETMSGLSTQIDTLYRVIGQIRPDYDAESGSGPGLQRDSRLAQSAPCQAPQQGVFRACQGSVQPVGRAASVRLTFKLYCLWFSLPLSVWFASGWIGLFVYWRALAGTARLLDWFSRKPSSARKERAPARHRGFTSSPFRLKSFESSPLHSSPGGARCSAIELEVQ